MFGNSNDFRYQRRPGTPLDRVNLSPYTIGRRIQPVNMAIRQQRRAYERAIAN